MLTTADTQETHSASSFASFLAALPLPSTKQGSGWSDAELADDVATLSYEQALQTHARTRSSSPSPASVTAERSQPARAARAASHAVPQRPVQHGRRVTEPADRKSASITIRLGAAESAQISARAAEAGLTVSAYLRSCVFEVEDLRAQVKQTLAEMRCAAPLEESRKPVPVVAPSTGWRDRILPRWVLHRATDHA